MCSTMPAFCAKGKRQRPASLSKALPMSPVQYFFPTEPQSMPQCLAGPASFNYISHETEGRRALGWSPRRAHLWREVFNVCATKALVSNRMVTFSQNSKFTVHYQSNLGLHLPVIEYHPRASVCETQALLKACICEF